MKITAIAIAVIVLSASAAQAQYGQRTHGSVYGGSSYGTYGTGSNPSSTHVQPHTNSFGSVTQDHYRTTPNNTQMDNYGTRGNVNPYTGTTGTRTPRY